MKQIKLTRDKYALVDDENFKYLNQFKWHCVPGRYTWYAARGVGPFKKQKKIYMQYAVINIPIGMIVDHVNKNGLDNQKENLRICTRSQNSHNYKIPRNNTSGFKGVFFDKQWNKWRAAIRINYKRFYLGSFENKIEAARSYDMAAKQYHGEFANLNFKEGVNN